MRTRLSICTKKKRHATFEEATLAIKSGIRLRAYQCDRCGAFHLTGRTKGKRIARPLPIVR